MRAKGDGLQRVEAAKTAAGLRTIALPLFALEVLKRRADEPQLGQLGVIFPSTAGTLRDPNNFGKQWRKVRDDLGVPGVTTHSFRKALATLIDEEGLSARIGADHLGHRRQHADGPVHEPRPDARGCRGSAGPDRCRKRRLNVGWHLPRLGKVPSTWGGRGSNPRPMDYESTALTD
ncbi:hypothetical protein SAMN05444580_10663 [Rhodococcus tukisamuensis]|uniref:Phage integrase family protein n=1 Tax=Rhodococcus tukisamuensis TaxID=168276 RepID=A0A1G6X2V9_9NOCA|nr:hypothetical protein SAMN05444580_10663 [Rhodococcus tukisamuensis]